MAPAFTCDYTDQHCKSWVQALAHFAGQPGVQGVEIGCFEGRSSLWFLENILQHPLSSLTCIDPWTSPHFPSNLIHYWHKVRWIKQPSGKALRENNFSSNFFHFAYIDGDHSASGVLEDAILIFPLLIQGGIIIFDDYEWKSETPRIPQTMPHLAIDAFLSVYQDKVNVLGKGYQVIVEKKVQSVL